MNFRKFLEGVIKIVIVINIVEMFIIIDDIIFVIDVGKMKEKRLFLSVIILYN